MKFTRNIKIGELYSGRAYCGNDNYRGVFFKIIQQQYPDTYKVRVLKITTDYPINISWFNERERIALFHIFNINRTPINI